MSAFMVHRLWLLSRASSVKEQIDREDVGEGFCSYWNKLSYHDWNPNSMVQVREISHINVKSVNHNQSAVTMYFNIRGTTYMDT